MQDIHAIRELLAQPRRIAIVTHARPDGDAVGSSLGLAHGLRSQGHEVTVVVPNAYADFLAWLPGQEAILDHQREPDQAGQALDQAELVFCLDFNVPARLEALAQKLMRSPATRILIDHHRDPEHFTRYRWHDTAASSTAELIYTFLEQLDALHWLNRDAAECLYVGMLTDTGSFRFSSTSPDTFRIAGQLLRYGLDIELIYERIYHTFTEDRMRFFGHSLLNKMQIFAPYRTGLIVINQQELEQFNVRTGDTEGLVNYPLSISGIVFAVLIIDRGNLRKFSFRSKGSFNVDQFARDHFNGGGHRNASGGQSTDSLDRVVEQFIALLPRTAGLAEPVPAGSSG
jgi:bifunctional oligoribonuclease and PAP phosphatase NrnA